MDATRLLFEGLGVRSKPLGDVFGASPGTLGLLDAFMVASWQFYGDPGGRTSSWRVSFFGEGRLRGVLGSLKATFNDPKTYRMN